MHYVNDDNGGYSKLLTQAYQELFSSGLCIMHARSLLANDHVVKFGKKSSQNSHEERVSSTPEERRRAQRRRHKWDQSGHAPHHHDLHFIDFISLNSEIVKFSAPQR
jgi:hypothetical protein